MNEVTVIGIDLAKNVFELCGQNQHGKVVLRKRVRRAQLASTLANLPSCLIGMEACGGAHYWAEQFKAMGHRVRLLPAQYVKAYLVGAKNDGNDADAICEAATRDRVPDVAVKSVDQRATQALHRVRQQAVKQFTALGNCARGLLLEFGICLPKGHAALRRGLAEVLDDPQLPEHLKVALSSINEQMVLTRHHIDRLTDQIKKAARLDHTCQRLMAVPGIGPITATAFVASVGDPQVFKNARQVPAWLGLVPKQLSSGERERLMGITKRGDHYLRGLLVHGARSFLRLAPGRSDPYSRWASRLAERRGHNKAVVAMANKNARILWAMMSHGERYRPSSATVN